MPKLIPVERKDIPEFTSEQEERAFWDTHSLGPRMLAEQVEEDPDLPSPAEMRAQRNERTQPIPIRFDADVLKRLRVLADRKHTGYQTLLKTFVVERLYEEELREGLVARPRASRA
jgi:hypothetical protein